MLNFCGVLAGGRSRACPQEKQLWSFCALTDGTPARAQRDLSEKMARTKMAPRMSQGGKRVAKRMAEAMDVTNEHIAKLQRVNLHRARVQENLGITEAPACRPPEAQVP